MEPTISQAEAQDLVNAVATQRDAAHNNLAQAQAALSKVQRESAKRIADLEAKVAELEKALQDALQAVPKNDNAMLAAAE